MRTTVNLDTDLLAEASGLTGVTERTALIHAGLRALIERESARRLARLGEIRRGMHDCGIGPSELARRMGASRSTVDRLLDMDNPSVTLLTLGRAAAVVGKRLDVTLSDAPSFAQPSGSSTR